MEKLTNKIKLIEEVRLSKKVKPKLKGKEIYKSSKKGMNPYDP